jgi:hypothetical protein
MTTSTTYLNCPRCGLSLEIHAHHLPDVTCPRCRGQADIRVPMYETERPRPPVEVGEPAHAG